MPEQEINTVQISYPSKAMFKLPPSGHNAPSNAWSMPGGWGKGRNVEASI